MVQTVFWSIQSLNDQVVSINGQQVQYQNVQTLVQANQNYVIVNDNTNVPVLVVTSSSPVTLDLIGVSGPYTSTSQTANFSGGRPTRPK